MYNPRTKEVEIGKSLSLLVSQLNLLSEIQANGSLCLKKQSKTVTKGLHSRLSSRLH